MSEEAIKRAANEAAPGAQIVRNDGDLLVYYSGFNLSKFVRFLALQPVVVAQREPSDSGNYLPSEIAKRMWQTFTATGDRWFKYAALRLEQLPDHPAEQETVNECVCLKECLEVRGQSPAVMGGEQADLREALAWALNEIELEFGRNNKAYPADKAKKDLFQKYKALASQSQPEMDVALKAANEKVTYLANQVERLTGALAEIEDLGVDGATGARLANIATVALSPLPSTEVRDAS
jgi:hypothetical protein